MVRIEWRKSSYSAGQSACIEVAHVPAEFHKSSYSQSEAACIEVAHVSTDFHTSSHSGTSSNCVEVAAAPAAAAIRDTKHRDLGALVFPSQEWRAFVSASKAGRL